jgi:hypothetical protein
MMVGGLRGLQTLERPVGKICYMASSLLPTLKKLNIQLSQRQIANLSALQSRQFQKASNQCEA